MREQTLEVAMQWGAVGLYIVATALLAYAVIFDRPTRVRWGWWVAAAGLLPHAVGLGLRWSAVGHGPYLMKYEVLSSNSFIAVALLLGFLWRRPTWSVLSVVVMPVVLLAMAIGLFSNPELRDLPPSLRSIWLIFHISFAKLAGGAFLLSAGSSVLTLLHERRHKPAWMGRAPSVEALDAYAVRFVGFGFVFWTLTIAAGAIWANQSWGKYWSWDPIETWSFITWVLYGTFLHARRFFRLQRRPTAWFVTACFAGFILTAMILPFLRPTLHAAYFQ